MNYELRITVFFKCKPVQI